MIVALPLTETHEFSAHFGGAAKAGLIEVDAKTKTIIRAWAEVPPEAEPCAWISWLAEKGVGCFLAGGMGKGAQERMSAAGIEVIVGVPAATPQALVEAWLEGTLISGNNACEGGHHKEEGTEGHHHHHHHHHHHGDSHPSGSCRCGH